MNSIKISFPFEANEVSVIQILREVANAIQNEDLSNNELMDGSYKIHTTFGSVFVMLNEEEE